MLVVAQLLNKHTQSDSLKLQYKNLLPECPPVQFSNKNLVHFSIVYCSHIGIGKVEFI